MPQTELHGNVEQDACLKKVLDTFMRHRRLIKIPAQLKKQQVILEKSLRLSNRGNSTRSAKSISFCLIIMLMLLHSAAAWSKPVC
jgi:hypothetical protein